MQWENVRMNTNITGPGSAELGTISKCSLYIFKKLTFKLWLSDFKTTFPRRYLGCFNLENISE